MPKPHVRYEVDWDHDLSYSNANSDITGDVPNSKARSWGSGRTGNSILASKAKAGKLVLPLLNTTGLYSSFNSSGSLFGLIKPGRRVRVHLGSRAAQLVSASTQSLSIADNAAMSTGDVDWMLAGMFTLDAIGSDRSMASKFLVTGNQREYRLFYDHSSLRFRLAVSGNGTSGTITTVDADNLGAPSVGTRYWIVIKHDATANTITIQVNDGTIDSAAHTAGLIDSTSSFYLGSHNTGAAALLDGSMGPVAFWKGSGAVPSAAELTWLYNNGNLRRHSDLGRTGDGSDLLTALVAWHELDEESGTRVDSHGSNDLTDNNSVLATEGVTNLLSWSGRLDSIVPAANIGKLPSATLTAFGNLSTWGAGKPRTTRQTNIRTDAAMDKLADDIGWPAGSTGARAFETGQTTMPLWFFSSAPGSPSNALQQGQAVEDTELGWFRESERDDVVFEDRHYRLSGARLTSQATYADDGSAGAITYKGIPQQDPIKDVFNRATAEVPTQSLGSLAVLWTLASTGASSPLIGPGETQRFIAEYPTPDAANGDIGAVWTTLVENTDYEANSASDDSGTDLSSSLTISLTKALDIIVIAITNDHASLSAYITLLQARGQPVQSGNAQSVEEFDQDSIDDFGDREFQLRAKFLGTMQEAVDQARYAVALNKDLVPKMKLQVLASKDFAHAREAGIRRLSDRITVESDTATKLGISSRPMFVEAIEHRITGGGSHDMILTVSDADSSGGKVIVLDTGPGLDTGILGY